MVVSMLLEYLYDTSFWLRVLFVAIGIIAIGGVSENASITVWFFVYCVLQRTVLSVADALIPEFPQWLFTIGLIIEIILAIIVIIMDFRDGPLCLLRGAIFCYENWLVSSILSRIVYECITGFSIGLLVLIVLIIVVTSFLT